MAKRTKGIPQMDGSPEPDDYIPRVGAGGLKPEQPSDEERRNWTPAFADQVANAQTDYRRGLSIRNAVAIYGRVVCRAAGILAKAQPLKPRESR